MAVAASGAQIAAMPNPNRAIGSRISHVALSAVITRESHPRDAAANPNPSPHSKRGWIVSVNRPTIGAIRINTPAIGTRSNADSIGERPRTSCAYNMIGKPMAVAEKDMVEIAKAEMEKLRSRKRLSGTSGSARL